MQTGFQRKIGATNILKGVQQIKEQLDLMYSQLQDKEQAKIIEECMPTRNEKKNLREKRS